MNWIEQRIRRAEQGDTELDLSVDPWNAGARDKFSEFPASILGLKHLTKLDLSGHDIKVLPIGFSKLESLRELSLRQNKGLRLQNGRELPSQLTHLDLSFLEQLGDIRFERLASLRSLTLAYSGLERFPAGAPILMGKRLRRAVHSPKSAQVFPTPVASKRMGRRRVGVTIPTDSGQCPPGRIYS